MTKNTRPFGFQKHNGLNFKLSVKNPNSRLAKMVNYVRANGPTTRMELATGALHAGSIQMLNSPRGWNGYAFSGACQGGFLVKYRVGRKVYYDLGVRSELVV